MRFLSGTSSSLSRSSVSRQRLDSGSARSVFEIFDCLTGNLSLIARWIETTTYEQSRCVGRLLQASATLRDGGESALALLCETTVVVQSPVRCSHRAGRVALQGKVIWARAREKGYHLKLLLPHYWCRVAALLSQTSRDHRCGRVTWQVLPPCWSSRLAGAHERNGTPLDHRCGRVAKLALERRRVQWHCPWAPTPEPSKEGHRPKNRHSERKGKAVSCRPRASRSSSQGRDVGSALSGLRLLTLPVGRSGWPVLIPCRSWLFPWFFSGWMTRALSQGPALSGTSLRTTLLSLTCCFILPIWELKVGGDGLRPLAQTNLL